MTGKLIIAALWGALAYAVLTCFIGCDVLPDAIEGAYEECPRGLVVAAKLCPGTAGKLATCQAAGEANGASSPVQVVWCLVEHAPAEDVRAYAECVPECPTVGP